MIFDTALACFIWIALTQCITALILASYTKYIVDNNITNKIDKPSLIREGSAIMITWLTVISIGTAIMGFTLEGSVANSEASNLFNIPFIYWATAILVTAIVANILQEAGHIVAWLNKGDKGIVINRFYRVCVTPLVILLAGQSILVRIAWVCRETLGQGQVTTIYAAFVVTLMIQAITFAVCKKIRGFGTLIVW